MQVRRIITVISIKPAATIQKEKQNPPWEKGVQSISGIVLDAGAFKVPDYEFSIPHSNTDLGNAALYAHPFTQYTGASHRINDYHDP